jgi:hypothetical protein
MIIVLCNARSLLVTMSHERSQRSIAMAIAQAIAKIDDDKDCAND